MRTFPTVFDKCCPGSIAKNVLSNACLVFKDGTPPLLGFKYVWNVMIGHSNSGGQMWKW